MGEEAAMSEREMFAEWAWYAFEDENDRPEDEWVDEETNPLIARAWEVRADLAPQWRPIEEAPKDGAMILAYDPGRYDVPHPMVHTMKWEDSYWLVWRDGPQFCEFRPTHWIPTPGPPEDA